jgi:hypothetical protein
MMGRHNFGQLTGLFALVFAVGPLIGRADISIRQWDEDLLSHPNGNVRVDADGLSSITKTISNSTTLESTTVTLTTAGTGVFESPGDMLGVDGPGADTTDYFDGSSGTGEAITLLFNTAVTITSLAFENIQWDPNGAGDADDDYEFVRVSIGGTHTYSLFSDSAVTSHPGYTGATGAIQGIAGDDFNGLSWSIPASTLVEFRFGADATSFTSQEGFRLDDISFTAVPEASPFFYGSVMAAVLCAWKWRQNWLREEVRA